MQIISSKSNAQDIPYFIITHILSNFKYFFMLFIKICIFEPVLKIIYTKNEALSAF